MKFNRLSQYKKRKILGVFCKDLTASVAAKILKINRNTINKYYSLFREIIFKIEDIFPDKERGILRPMKAILEPNE
jgi:transposase-like protein